MLKRHAAFEKLSPSYLFPEIQRRKEVYLKENPGAQLISLGIGDTVLPLPPVIAEALAKAALELGTEKGYSGYGKEQGLQPLREGLVSRFYPHLSPDEIFISDGAKSDLGRLQALFGGSLTVGIQDPAYPVYLDGSILQGVQEIKLLPCTPENNFFPTLPPGIDLLYFCNPNNPTGKACTYEELEKIVAYAKKNKTLILYDSAYAAFIQDPALPKTIYDIPGAEEVAIEIGSFSKMAGFTGIRLGWTVIPRKLTFSCGSPIAKDYHRFASTIFNGASNIVQKGGIAALTDTGYAALQKNITYTQENSALLKKAFSKMGYAIYGGDNAPYLWIATPGRQSWDVFQEFLEEKHLIVTPGKGYGPSGEHFIRASAFAHRSVLQKRFIL